MSDYIKRTDAIEAVCGKCSTETRMECALNGYFCCDRRELEALPSADAEQGYTEWLEKIIVDAETFEWLCEDTPCKEWCDKNCHYSSIQAECLRHLYEVSKGGDSE